jgi:formylglycine-generating enzyme required for sulfatase activity
MRYLFALTALLFALPAHAVVMEWVTVGDPGNVPDTDPYLYPSICGPDWDQPCGSVPYTYRIGKYEVTNAQYAEFLNAVAATDTNLLYNPDMDWGGITRSGSPGSYSYGTVAGRENLPVLFVGFNDTVRFANWLHNGQPTGMQDSTTTEDGAYPFIDFWTVGARNPGATVFLPSEDEWYKAAYYDAASMSYLDYPAGSDTPPTCALPGAMANMANCDYAVGSLTEVGSYAGSPSPYGTFDQAGNAWEWTETIINGSNRGLRGGSYGDTTEWIAAWRRNYAPPNTEYVIGFRLASLAAQCEDELDNDGDGFTDYPWDPGCTEADDLSESDPTLPCDDGADNDSDGALDYPADIGCKNPTWSTENPQCADGIDNADNDDPPLADWDGAGMGDPDPQCSAPWEKSEAPSSRPCGLGAELALLLPPLMWFLRRRSL